VYGFNLFVFAQGFKKEQIFFKLAQNELQVGVF
jgi:hypothetical protein